MNRSGVPHRFVRPSATAAWKTAAIVVDGVIGYAQATSDEPRLDVGDRLGPVDDRGDAGVTDCRPQTNRCSWSKRAGAVTGTDVASGPLLRAVRHGPPGTGQRAGVVPTTSARTRLIASSIARTKASIAAATGQLSASPSPKSMPPMATTIPGAVGRG